MDRMPPNQPWRISLMRTPGTLTKWNDERGFGFISPAQGSDELFVHISAFARDGGRPQIGELISFETETGPNGKRRAIRVMRAGQQLASHRRGASTRAAQSSGLTMIASGLLAVAAVGALGYSLFTGSGSQPPVVRAASASTASSASSTSFHCDGRTMCSQMTSCAEARYFLEHCPNPKMDGNEDGEPCEQQWCN